MRELEESAAELHEAVLRHAKPEPKRVAMEPLLEMHQNDIEEIGKRQSLFKREDGMLYCTKSHPLVQTLSARPAARDEPDLQIFQIPNGSTTGKFTSVKELTGIERAAWGVLTDASGERAAAPGIVMGDGTPGVSAGVQVATRASHETDAAGTLWVRDGASDGYLTSSGDLAKHALILWEGCWRLTSWWATRSLPRATRPWPRCGRRAAWIRRPSSMEMGAC